jgi:outer membrane receptor protein involved in Fe transport
MQRFKYIGCAMGVVGIWFACCLTAQAMVSGAKFDIAAGAAPTTLKDFAAQAHMQLLFDYRALQGVKTPELKGELTPEEALKILLGGSGLTFRQINDHTIAIMAPGAVQTSSLGLAAATAAAADAAQEKGAAQDKEGKTSSSSQFRVAQADQGKIASDVAVIKQTPSSAELTEIIVTARKREERLVDVPISIVAVGAEELRERQIVTLEDLPAAVPGLSLQRAGNTYTFEIRGISNSNGGVSSLIGLYIDEADATLPGNGTMQPVPATYDLERVEVLRGPQGTLYGEGSAGGTIHIVTKNPDLTHLAFDSQVAAQFTEGGSPSERIQAVVNVPLIDNQLGLRVATTFDHEGGWIDQPAAGLKDINGGDLTDVRVKGLWQPDPNFTLSVMANINRSDRGIDVSDVSSPQTFTQVFNLTTTPRARKDHDLYNLTATYDMASVGRVLNTVTYLSVYDSETYKSVSAPTSPPPATGQNFNIYEPLVSDFGHLLADEFRVTSPDAGKWQWVLGGLYRHFRTEHQAPSAYFGFEGSPLPPPYSPAENTETLYESWSVFGDTNYRFADRVTVGVGARYFKENQEHSDFIAQIHNSGEFHSTDPRIYAQYKLTSNANLYASAAKGFRSGGSNSYPGQPPFGPEDVWTYELGSKGAFPDARVGFDFAAYLSDYSQYQQFALNTNNEALIFNAGRVRIKGVEGSLTWNPLEHWRVEGRGSYVNARIVELNGTYTPETVGDPIDGVPRYQFTLSDQHEFSWLGKQDVIRVDYNQTSSIAVRSRLTGPWFYASSPVIQILNLHLSSMLKDNLRVGFSVQNLLNDQGYVTPGWYVGNGQRSRPRTYGVEFSAAFD